MVVRLGLVTAALAFGVQSAAGQEPAYEIVARKNVMVPMRDGVKLATDIYLRAERRRGGRPLPIVLSRTPYGKGGAGSEAKSYVPYGYVVSARTRAAVETPRESGTG